MGYSTGIGRVGGLAIALGIGTAVALAPAVAYADSSDTGSADASATGGSAAPRSSSARAPRTASATGNAQGDDASAAANSASGVGSSGSGPVAGAQSKSKAGNLRSHARGATPKPSGNSNRNTPEVDSPDAGPVAAQPVASSAASTPSINTSSPAAAAPARATITGASQQSAQAAPSLQTVVDAVVGAVRYTAAQWVNGLLGPLLGSGSGNNPGQSGVLWTVLAWARRELERVNGAAGVADAPTMSQNLIVNGGAELSTPSANGFTTVTMPGWDVTGVPTVIKYGTQRNLWPVGLSFAWPDLPGFLSFPSQNQAPPNSGEQFFGGGNLADSKLTQTIDLSGAAADIDLGTVTYDLSGWLGGYQWWNPSEASVQVNFLDQNQLYLGSGKIGPVSLIDRLFWTGFRERETSGLIPVGTRSVQVVLTLDDKNPVFLGTASNYNDAYADNLSFTISADLPAPPDPTPPPVTVGPLDHLFMVYMENKGYNDMVGSPYAPFLNSLINAYGFAESYYGLTHPSLPNYYPVIIGSDYPGITYNCEKVCMYPDDMLTTNLDNAGKMWKGYAQSMPYPGALEASGDFSLDQLPFWAFDGIGNNADYAAEHLFPLEQMAIDLQSPETAPAYAWWGANEDFNGEGPVDFPFGMLKFAIGQLLPNHPYNQPALDQFLQETVPVIMNSNVWNDVNEKSAIVVTFDEDNDNMGLGFGTEGNHIVTVVIPSPGAVLAGMRSGHFVVNEQYNHYNLLRTIEDSLGITTRLTNNDAYAKGMDAFWNTPTP
jgi:hypothetical protein